MSVPRRWVLVLIPALCLAASALILLRSRRGLEENAPRAHVPVESNPRKEPAEIDEPVQSAVFRMDGKPVELNRPPHGKTPDLPQEARPFILPAVELPATCRDVLERILEAERAGNGLEREAFAAAYARLLASDPASLQELIRLLDTSKEQAVVRTGVILLGRTASADAVSYLSGLALSGTSGDLRLLAIESLLQNGRSNAQQLAASEPKLRPIRGDDVSPDRLKPLIELIRTEKDASVFSKVVSWTSSFQDPLVNFATTGHPDLTAALISALGHEKDPARAAPLLSALSETRRMDVVEPVLSALQSASDSLVIQMGLRALANKPEMQSTLDLKLRYASDHPNQGVRSQAIESIRVADGNRQLIAERLGTALRTEKLGVVRIAGIIKLAQCGPAGRSIIEHLAKGDPDPQVRDTARHWLER